MTSPAATTGRPTARHPVRVDTDGDFALHDLHALPVTGPARRIDAAQAALSSPWRIDGTTRSDWAVRSAQPSTPTQADVDLLHRIETGGLFQPPVRERVAALTPEVGAVWLALAAHWIDMSRSCGDLRFLNAACKLIGAVWLHHPHSRAEPSWRELGLTDQLAAVGHLLGEATEQLQRRLANRVVLTEPAAPNHDMLSADSLTETSRARIIVLAGTGSQSAGQLVTTAVAIGLPIRTVCWYAPSTAQTGAPSSYSRAWYPPTPHAPAATPGIPDNVPVTTARSWDQVTAAILAADADLVLLVGMPVVPSRVLDTATLGVLNAHNGALPHYRGMDAVGWALLHNHPIVCSLHLARPAVDTGEVIATHPVPTTPTATLAARVKTAQLRLLLAGAAHVASTGTLPDLTPQPTAGTQYYRLHPHLKRVLDDSPYARGR